MINYAIKWGKIQKLLLNAPQDGWRMARRTLKISNQPRLAYFVPDANWATDWVGRYVVDAAVAGGLPALVTSTPQLSSDTLLHYGDLGSFIHNIGRPHNRRNRLIATVFHGYLNGQNKSLIQNIEKFVDHSYELEAVVTASTIMQKRLKEWLPPALPVYKFPIGVDVSKFRPIHLEAKEMLRDQLGIPKNAFCIGSFQKDGVGWQAGVEPKLIKGPDVFVATVARLRSIIPNLFVVLTAPARGYVKQELEKCGIPYIHHELDNYLDITRYYQTLDCYLVASREEGGPKAILESMASGIPLVTTKVGMASDVVQHQINGLLCDVEDTEALAQAIEQVFNDHETAGQMVNNGLKTAADYAWPKIGRQYVEQLYEPLLRAEN